jgi:hypothetical protein
LIILDTNVVSETVKPNCDDAVLDWLDLQNPENLYFTSIGVAEIYVGLELLPDGKRKSNLAQEVVEAIEDLFEYRIMPFDADSAIVYAKMMVELKKAGKPISIFDAQMAAIARCNGFAVATRDTRPFIECGLDVINPWTKAIS